MSETAVIEAGETMPAEQSEPQSILSLAIQKGAGVDQLEALMRLQERHDANEARKAFHRAMNAFRSNPPKIAHDRQVQAGPARYTHSSLANVVQQISMGMAPHGLSFRWETAQEERAVTVTCVIQHINGHEERTTLTAPPDDSGRKNSIQQIASTVTYLERYTLLAATGLATQDQIDDDAEGAYSPPVTSEQAENLRARLDACGADVAKFCQFLDVASIADIREAEWPRALKAVEAKEAQARG